MRDKQIVAGQFGENLRRCRKGRELSLAELGRRAGLHYQEIRLLEEGKQRPRIDTATKLAGALEVPMCELTRGIEWRPGKGFVRVGHWEGECRHATELGTALRVSLWDLKEGEI